MTTTTITFSRTRADLESWLRPSRWTKDAPARLDGASFAFQPEWERLGRALHELSDLANAEADKTDDVDGPAWDTVVEYAQEAAGFIYPNGDEWRPTATTRERREAVASLLADLLTYLS